LISLLTRGKLFKVLPMLWLSSLAFAVLGCSGLLSDEVVVALNEDDFVAGDSSSAEDGVRQRGFFADELICPQSPVPQRELTLVNLSDLRDADITNCFNFGVENINPLETDVMMVLYPVGPLIQPPGEVADNDTMYRGAGFTPVVTEKQRDSMAQSIEQFLLSVCGPDTAQFAASQVARFAELGGGQQVQAAFAPEGECARKRLVILSIDPDRAGPSTELVTTFFHEVFHAIQKSDPDVCTYSADQADSFWIHEAGASYFGLETSATLAGIDSEVVWDAHMGFVRQLLSRGEIDRQLSEPAIAEKGAIALRLLVTRGELSLADLLDGSLFQGCNDSQSFRAHNIETAETHWFDCAEVAGSFRFSEAALAP
jgi:hypothetical protein